MKTVTVAIPVFNEAPNIERAYTAVSAVMKPLSGQYDYEILFTDNCSTDGSFEIIERLARKDPRVRGARFSRNFGYQGSVYTLYVLSKGDAVIHLDCDLQDPPEMIPEFLARWESGYEYVYGIRKGRPEGPLLHFVRRLFYRLINALSDDDLPVDVGDFRLVDRKIVDVLRQIYDCSPYLRGQIASLGFRQTGIEYARRKRVEGKTSFDLWGYVEIAIDGIVNHSVVPLRLATYTGVVAAGVSGTLIAVYTTGKIFLGYPWPPGFTTITSLILISLSFNAIFLGIIGEYLGRIYRQMKGRPVAIIDRVANIERWEKSPGVF